MAARRSVAQPGRALALGARRRRFESCRSDHFYSRKCRKFEFLHRFRTEFGNIRLQNAVPSDRRVEATIYAKTKKYPYYRLAYRAAGKCIVGSLATYSEAKIEVRYPSNAHLFTIWCGAWVCLETQMGNFNMKPLRYNHGETKR